MPEVNWRGQPAHFVGNVEWPTRADNDDEDGTGTVIFGNQPEGGYFQISGITVKVAEPLVEDVGEHVILSTPTLGRNDHDEPPQIGGQVEGFAGQTEEQGPKRPSPRQFYNGKAHSELLEDLDRAWYVPKRLEVWFDAEGSGDPRAPSFCRDVRFIRG